MSWFGYGLPAAVHTHEQALAMEEYRLDQLHARQARKHARKLAREQRRPAYRVIVRSEGQVIATTHVRNRRAALRNAAIWAEDPDLDVRISSTRTRTYH